MKRKLLLLLCFVVILCHHSCHPANVNNKNAGASKKTLDMLSTSQESQGENDEDKKDYSEELHMGLFDNGNDLDKFKSTSLPIFLAEPEDAYIVKSKPAILKCKTAHALNIIFKCSGNTDPPTSSESHFDPHTGVQLQEATATVSRNLVEEYFGKDAFQCDCTAWSPRGEIKSRPGVVIMAYLKKQFTVTPLSARIEPGSKLEIKCTPPHGNPLPQISWLRNNEVITNSPPHVTITKDGNLFLLSSKNQDSANYTCVAENIAARRLSDPALIVVRGDKKWSEWSVCSKDCIKYRRRLCNAKLTSMTHSNVNVQDDCSDVGTSECRDGDCQQKEIVAVVQPTPRSTDKYVYGSLIFLSILCIVLAILFAKSNKRKRRVPSFISTDADTEPKNYDSPDKKYSRATVEPTKKASFSYEYNGMAPDYNQIQFPPQENHYHEPTLAITYSVPVDKVHTMNNQCSTTSGYGSKRVTNSDTISSSNESLNSTQVIEIESSSTSLMNDRVQRTNMIEQMVTSNGGWLELEHLHTSLSIPELTFERTRKYNIFLTVLHNEFIKNQITCNFNDNSTHLSSIIYCGPSEVLLNKPVILKFPHCADKFENWDICLLHNRCSENSQQSKYSKPFVDGDDIDKWRRIASTKNDVVNPQAFIQLDAGNAFIISRVLGKLLLVGECKESAPNVNKRMKIALFGPRHKLPSTDFNIRIYIVEDYPSSIDYCSIIEKNLGNTMLAESRDFLFKNNREDVWLELRCSGGWQTRNESQKIPYSHVWKNSYLLHCDFLLEKLHNNCSKLNMEIIVKQKHGNDILLNNILFSS